MLKNIFIIEKIKKYRKCPALSGLPFTSFREEMDNRTCAPKT